MIHRLASLLVLLIIPPAAAQELLFDGVLAAVGPETVVRLDAPFPVPRGTLVYAFETVDSAGRAVGRLTGTFRVLRPDSLDLVVTPVDPAAPTPDVRVGQRVQIDLSTRPGEVEVRTNPTGARISWNGDLIGQTPFSVVLAPGEYTFLLRVPGYDLVPLAFTIEPNVIISVGATLFPSSENGR